MPPRTLTPTPAVQEVPKLTVSSQTKSNDVGIQSLIGDYVDKGLNHGKRFYQKVQKIQGFEDVQVFLYYWDARDGPDFSGWWFGDKVGGTQVWARCTLQSPTPPRTGWKVPWDGPVVQGVLLVDPYKGPTAAAPKPAGALAGAVTATAKAGAKGVISATTPALATLAAKATPATASVYATKVKAATTKVENAEKLANAVVARAKVALTTGKATPTFMQELVTALTSQQTALAEVQTSLTKDISEVRQGGVAATTHVTELSKLSPRIRVVQAAITEHLTKVKANIAAKPAAPVVPVQTAAQKELLKKQEEKDAQDLETQLPMSHALVAACEESMQAVLALADPLVSEPPEEGSDVLKSAIDEVEAGTIDAQNKLNDARKEISTKLVAAQKYQPEVRKVALTEYAALQTKLNEVQKRLTSLKSFRKDFKAKVEAKKVAASLVEKINEAELEVEKAALMTAVIGEASQMSEDEVLSIEKAVTTAHTSINDIVKSLEQKLQGSAWNAALKDELNQLKDRTLALRKKAEGVTSTMQKQRAGLLAKQIITQAIEKVVAAEENLAICQEAEMPFLKGLEVLPPDESSKALTESEQASVKAEFALTQARSFIQGKLNVDIKRFPQDLMSSTSDELKQLSARVEAVGKKVANFKKETSERKLTALLADVIVGLETTEKHVKAYVEVTKVFNEDLNSVTVEALQSAVEKEGDVAKEATAALTEVRTQMTLKQKEAKGADATAALAKLQGRYASAQSDFTKFKKASMDAEKLIKGKEVLANEVKSLADADAEVKRAESLAAGAEAGEELSEEASKELGNAILVAENVLMKSMKSLESHLVTTAPTLKAALQKLAQRNKAAQTQLDQVLSSKETREHVLGEAYLREAKQRVAKVDEAMEKVNDAELPYLKGLEVLPLTEASAMIAVSESAADELNGAITEARTYLAAKSLIMKKFIQDKAKPITEELAALTGHVSSISAKLMQFRRDTDNRKRTAELQEAGQKMTTAENEVAKVVAAVVPLEQEEASSMSEEEATAVCTKVGAIAKDAQAAVDEVRGYFTQRQKDVRSVASLAETAKSLQARLTETSNALAKAKKVVSETELKFSSKKVLAESTSEVDGLEGEVKKAEEAASPLVEKNGEEFLVASSIASLTSALRGYAAEKGLDIPALYLEAVGGDSSKKLPKEEFQTYLSGLPEATGHPEIAFTEERQAAIFAAVDKDNDGNVNESDFKAMFMQKYVCINDISMTDGLKVSDSKTIGNLHPSEVLISLGEVSKDDATGVERIEAKVLSDGRSGFVTVKGNQGTLYLKTLSAYHIFCHEMDKAIEERLQNVKKVVSSINAKTAELTRSSIGLAAAAAGPLAEVREEFNKLRPKAAAHLATIEQLKKKVVKAKADFLKAELAEKNAHIEAKERREAESILEAPLAALADLEAETKTLEDAAAPLTSLKAEEVSTFEQPATCLEEVEKLLASIQEKVVKAKASVKEEQTKLFKATTGPLLEAKKQLGQMTLKVETCLKKALLATQAVRKACNTIIEGLAAKVSGALRQEVSKEGKTADEFFNKLADEGKSTIEEAVFCKCVKALPDITLSDEHVKLLFKHVQGSSSASPSTLSKRSFSSFVQKYYIVQSGIAITDEFELATAKVIRKAEPEEIIELLEGPQTDEKLSMTRIRGRSLLDGTQGWISSKGNQGTPYLKEVEKPFYSVSGNEEVALNSEFKLGEGDQHRSLKPGEVLELLEGPRKESYQNGLRARGKANSDNATGWFTIRDKQGQVFAKADGKLYTCVSPVVLTDDKDVKNCKAIQKLEAGTTFVVEEGPVEESGVLRVKARLEKQDKVGWITIKGNAGTVFAEASTKHYSVSKEVPLTKLFLNSSEVLRQLEPGETIQVLEGPKDEIYQPASRLKVRSTLDGVTGWATIHNLNMKRWTPIYRCAVAAPLQNTLKVEGAEDVREIVVGEILELLEGPMEEAGELRMKAKAKKDNATGWLTIRNSEGKRFLSS